jgi:hypothetical protein
MSTNNDNDDEFSFRNYWANVRAIAKEAMEQDEDARGDFVHESVDGSRWVFVYYGARQTLEHSTNDERIFEELGADALQGVQSLAEVNVRAAYVALRADVEEALAELIEQKEEVEAAD